MGDIIYFCRSCGTCFSGVNGLEEEACPECGQTELIDTGVQKDQWHLMTVKEQEQAKITWLGNKSLSIKKCVKCGMNIPYIALKCPYCRSKQKRESSGSALSRILKMLLRVLALLFIVILISSIIGAITSTSSSSRSTNTNNVSSKAANMTIEEYENEAISVSYDELKRNPNTYKGKYIVMKIYIAQLVTDKQWRAYTYGNSQWTRYDSSEEFYVFDKRTSGTNVIENDVVTVYGVYNGTVSVERAITRTKENVPSINVYKLELNK